MTESFFNEPWDGLQQYWGDERRHQENSARPADVLLMFDSIGTYGEILHPKMMDFETTFVEEPCVTYGFRVDEEAGDELVDGQWPRAYGFIYDYRTTPRGFYVGAYLAVVVDIPIMAEMPKYAIHHYFRLQGIAMKELPSDELDE